MRCLATLANQSASLFCSRYTCLNLTGAGRARANLLTSTTMLKKFLEGLYLRLQKPTTSSESPKISTPSPKAARLSSSLASYRTASLRAWTSAALLVLTSAPNLNAQAARS